jgi:hypothetical protein
MHHNCRNLLFLFAIFHCTIVRGNDVAKLKLSNPQPYQVIQREGYEPTRSHEHNVHGAEVGYADVELRGTKPKDLAGEWQYRIVALPGAFGTDIDWKGANDFKDKGSEFECLIEVPAGGWYRFELICKKDDERIAEAIVEPVAIGEVFLVAGQSYAGGHNDELLKVTDPFQRVSAYDAKTKTWKVANDPQPNVGDGGTIWPALGDLLVPVVRVPVGFANVSVGATSSKQWMPDGELHRQLVATGKELKTFRAVLWQQGESDVIEKTTLEMYVKNLLKIRETAAREWQFEPTWLLAKSTLHPTVYNNPVGEERIRTAIHQLWKRPHFGPGPDTDLLSGENRGDKNSRQHFTGLGQRRAALLWFVSVWNELEKPGK